MKYLMMTAFALILGTASFAQTEKSANTQVPVEKAKETPKQAASTQPTQTEPGKTQQTGETQPTAPAAPAKPADPVAPAAPSGSTED